MCYRYCIRDGGNIYPLPARGKIEYDESGKMICHICGRSFDKLSSHVKSCHGMTMKKYKSTFRLFAAVHKIQHSAIKHISKAGKSICSDMHKQNYLAEKSYQ